MYKVIFGAKRRPGMSREDFAHYWLNVHAEKGRNSPGLVRYVVNIAPDLTGSERGCQYRERKDGPQYQALHLSPPKARGKGNPVRGS